MKNLKLTSLLVVVLVLMYSCGRQLKTSRNNVNNEPYTKYLLSIINDTTFFEFPEYCITDKSIYPILDSVISLSEKCQYFDSRNKYLNSFRFGIISEKGNRLYSIDAHLSPAQAIGLVLLETRIIQQIKNIGIFYYKNYLFVIPSSSAGEQTESYFPFAKNTSTTLKIRAPKFFDEHVYSSQITFDKQDSGYKIIENRICGDKILIR